MGFRNDFLDRPELYQKLVRALVPYVDRLVAGDPIRITDVHAICHVAYLSSVSAARKQQIRMFIRHKRDKQLIPDVLAEINASSFPFPSRSFFPFPSRSSFPPPAQVPKRKRKREMEFIQEVAARLRPANKRRRE